MKKRLSVLSSLVTFACMMMPAVADAAYSVVSTNVTTVGALNRTDWVVQDGSSSFERFHVYNVHLSSGVPDKPVMLAPSIVGGFREYEESLTNTYSASLVGVLATGGYDVWGISQRTEGIAFGTCEALLGPCGPMVNWGWQTLLNDIGYVRSQVTAAHGSTKPVVGGLSMGGALGFAVVNSHPSDYAGVLSVDGGLYQTDTVARTYALGWCTALNAELTLGTGYDSAPISQETAANLVVANPGNVVFANTFGLTLDQPVANPYSFRPGYIIDQGNLLGQLTYADVNFAARALATYNNYGAVHTLRDFQCSLANNDTSFFSNLGSYTGRIFVHSAGLGFGPIPAETAALSSGATVTSYNFPSYGHRDAFFGYNHNADLDQPLLNWLALVFP